MLRGRILNVVDKVSNITFFPCRRENTRRGYEENKFFQHYFFRLFAEFSHIYCTFVRTPRDFWFVLICHMSKFHSILSYLCHCHIYVIVYNIICIVNMYIMVTFHWHILLSSIVTRHCHILLSFIIVICLYHIRNNLFS